MKRAAVGILLVSLFAGTAMAGQGYRRPDFKEPPRAANNDRRDDSRWNGDRHDNDRRGNDHRDWNRDRDHHGNVRYAPPPRVVYRPAPPPRVIYRHAPVRYGVYHQPRGYYSRSWHRGDRLPVAYYGRPYVIGDYDRCGLRRPPVGYHWVRVNHDAVLAVIATGVVLDVAYNLFG